MACLDPQLCVDIAVQTAKQSASSRDLAGDLVIADVADGVPGQNALSEDVQQVGTLAHQARLQRVHHNRTCPMSPKDKTTGQSARPRQQRLMCRSWLLPAGTGAVRGRPVMTSSAGVTFAGCTAGGMQRMYWATRFLCLDRTHASSSTTWTAAAVDVVSVGLGAPARICRECAQRSLTMRFTRTSRADTCHAALASAPLGMNRGIVADEL